MRKPIVMIYIVAAFAAGIGFTLLWQHAEPKAAAIETREPVPDYPLLCAERQAIIVLDARIKDRDANGVTTLMNAAAIAHDDPWLIKALIDAGANVNARDGILGATVLMHAAWHTNSPEIVAILIGAGADTNARDEDGETALMYAAGENKNRTVVAELIADGANQNLKNKKGETAMAIARRRENAAAIYVLNKTGAKE